MAGLPAADLAGMAQASPWGHLIDKFAELRSRDPAGTEAPLSEVHRGDIFKLDGRDGARAVTWHDTTHGVVWLLAFTPEHDYEMMVRRAATPSPRGGASQLLPPYRTTRSWPTSGRRVGPAARRGGAAATGRRRL